MLSIRPQRTQVIGDGPIVLRGMCKYLNRQVKAGIETDFASIGLHLSQHTLVIRGVANHDHIFMIFSRRAQHRGATDIDILDGVFQRAIVFGDRLLEGVQIHDHHVDGWNIVLRQRIHMLRQVAPRQDTAMNFRVQGFDTPIQHFRKAGVIRHFGHR